VPVERSERHEVPVERSERREVPVARFVRQARKSRQAKRKQGQEAVRKSYNDYRNFTSKEQFFLKLGGKSTPTCNSEFPEFFFRI